MTTAKNQLRVRWPGLRSAASAAATLALAAALAGCTGPWSAFYEGQRAAAASTHTSATAAIRVIQKHPGTLSIADPPTGLVELGSSRFIAGTPHGSGGLERLARDIGAEEVWWAVEPAGSVTTSGTTRLPTYERSRTKGTVTAADGSTQRVDLATTTSRWEDVPYTRTETRWFHAARFFGEIGTELRPR